MIDSMNKIALTLTLILIPLHNALALDAGCEPIIKTSEASANAPTWQKVTTLTGNKNFKMEIRKIDGQYYSLTGGDWKKQDASFGAAVQSFVEQARNGAIKISQCKDEGSKTVNGVNTVVVSYRVEMIGAPAANATLYIGKADGLPYAEISDATQSYYSYKDVVVPIQ
jgi:hypothetical protein